MKVALINTSDSGGGAAEACMRLLKALQLQQVDVTMVVQHKKRAEDHVYTIEETALDKARFNFNFFYERLPFIAFQERDKTVRFAFSTANGAWNALETFGVGDEKKFSRMRPQGQLQSLRQTAVERGDASHGWMTGQSMTRQSLSRAPL